MTRFIDDNNVTRFAFIYLLLASVTISMVLYYLVIRNKMKTRYFILVLKTSMIDLFMLIVYTTCDKYLRNGQDYNKFYELAMKVPQWILFTISTISISTHIYVLVVALKHYRAVITPSSIARGINSLNLGICICDKKDIPRLVNKYMDSLAFKLTNSYFYSIEKFFSEVGKNPKNKILSDDNSTVIIESSGFVYRFVRDTFVLNDINYSRIIATDVTEEYILLEELRESNLIKEDYQRKLKEYSKSIEKLTIEEEILNTKMNIHSNYGQMLIIGKMSITNKEQRREYIQRWNNVSNLVFESESDDLDDLLYMASTLGIEIDINCDIRDEHKTLVTKLLYEVFTNTSKHTNSKRIILSYKDNTYTCHNDEACEEFELVEGGGLSSFRNLALKNNAIVEYEINEYFKINLTFKGDE